MAQITVTADENSDKAIRRFKRVCGKEGIITEATKRRCYEKPSLGFWVCRHTCRQEARSGAG